MRVEALPSPMRPACARFEAVSRAWSLIRWARAIAVVLAIAWSLAGCALVDPRPDPVWVTDEVDAQSDRVLFEVTRIAMEKTGFPLAAGLDETKLIAKSGWMISLAPFRGKGFREQCEVHYKPVGSLAYEVQVRVRREKNDDLLRPLDLTYAEWVAEPDNEERARIVLQYIKSMLSDEPKAPAQKPDATKKS